MSALSQPPVPWLWQTGSALLVWHFHVGLPSSSGLKNIETAFDPYPADIVRDSEEPNFTLQDPVAMGRLFEREKPRVNDGRALSRSAICELVKRLWLRGIEWRR